MKPKSSSPWLALAAAAGLAMALMTSGCLAVAAISAAGAGAAVAYHRGSLETWLDAGIDQSAHATAQALWQLGYAKPEEKIDASYDTFTTHDAAGTKIEVRLGHGGPGLTQLTIRVGVLGDEARSRAILDKIKAGL